MRVFESVLLAYQVTRLRSVHERRIVGLSALPCIQYAKGRNMPILQNHYEESRPWGSFERFTQNESSTVKVLRVSPNKRLSLQSHKLREEYWCVLSGSGVAVVNDERIPLAPATRVEVPQGAVHRLEAGAEGLTLLEIALGVFDEDDITRYEDDFGRAREPEAT